MRFQKGDKVEVYTKQDFPCGAWRTVEIVSGNGHYYDVRNDLCAITERVSVRPLPPPVLRLRDWMPGDIVEVFERMCWTPAMVSNVIGNNHCLVRLLGSSQSVPAHTSDVRVRQIWKHGQWIVVGNGFGTSEDGKSHPGCYQMSRCKAVGAGGKRKLREEDDNVIFQNFQMGSSRTLMRSSPTGLSCLDAYTGDIHKRRATEKQGSHHQINAEHSSTLREKVDAVTSPQYLLGEKHMHASFNNKIHRKDKEKPERNGVNGYFPGRRLEHTEAVSGSSVGSCSSSASSPYRLPHINPDTDSESFDSDSHSSNAESFHGSKPEICSLPLKEDRAVETHELELHAYRCTMRALYLSGSLSWEQEELMTNLRLALHISNDEHLLEIRNLICGKEKHIIC